MTNSTEPQLDDVRASDDERERVADLLRNHGGEGRLEIGELEDRLERAYSARTRAELAVLTGDLPELPVPPRTARRLQRRALSSQMTAFALVNLMLIAIWAASGAGYFWPVWPLLGWGIGIVSHASQTGWRVPLPVGRHCGRRARSTAS